MVVGKHTTFRIAEYFYESRRKFRFDHTSSKESLLVSVQGAHGKSKFKGILGYIREINLKASERSHCKAFENESPMPNSILGYTSDHLIKHT